MQFQDFRARSIPRRILCAPSVRASYSSSAIDHRATKSGVATVSRSIESYVNCSPRDANRTHARCRIPQFDAVSVISLWYARNSLYPSNSGNFSDKWMSSFREEVDFLPRADLSRWATFSARGNPKTISILARESVSRDLGIEGKERKNARWTPRVFTSRFSALRIQPSPAAVDPREAISRRPRMLFP